MPDRLTDFQSSCGSRFVETYGGRQSWSRRRNRCTAISLNAKVVTINVCDFMQLMRILAARPVSRQSEMDWLDREARCRPKRSRWSLGLAPVIGHQSHEDLICKSPRILSRSPSAALSRSQHDTPRRELFRTPDQGEPAR